jgi:hypothetical protein
MNRAPGLRPNSSYQKVCKDSTRSSKAKLSYQHFDVISSYVGS